jgi:hypothetical protein
VWNGVYDCHRIRMGTLFEIMDKFVFGKEGVDE